VYVTRQDTNSWLNPVANPHEMKSPLIKTTILLALLTVLDGCASIRSQRVAEAARLYQDVTREMSRDEVYSALGPPQATRSDGLEQWRVTEGAKVAELSLRFEPDGSITEIGRRSIYK